MKMKTGDFKLIPIDGFDARRGYSRWDIPGVGTTTGERGSRAIADIWVNPKGNLVTRFSSCGYTLHFKIQLNPERQITHDMQDDITEFLWQMLQVWIADGIDDDLECDDVIYTD